MSESTPEQIQSTKQRLLQIALEIIRNDGLGGLTIRRIAEAASVSVSVVHHHYINKQGLIDACKTDFYKGVGKVVTEVVSSSAGRPIEESVERAVRALWSHARANVPILRVLASDAFGEGELIERYRSYDDRPFIAAATGVLAPALGMPVKTTRARLQAMGALVTRFAVSSDVDLHAVFGQDCPDAALDAENELVAIAKLLFLG